MRRQKYRIWHIKRKVMLIAYNLAFTDEGDEPLACESVQVRLDDEWQWLEDDEFILMQFTGLKDKKGKAIYEGDDISFSMSQSQHYRGYVEWSEKGLCYLVYCYWKKHDEIPHLCDGFELNFTYRNTCVKRLDSDCFDLEIIGNVTENPELLK